MTLAETFAARRDALLAGRGTSTRKHVRIDRAALLAVGASEELAIDVGALRGAVALGSEPASAATMRAAVGVVSIEGPLAQRAYFEQRDGLCAFVDGYDFIADRFVAALNDDAVDSVVVRIDSPGGDVPGLEEATKRMAAAARESGKPVVVYLDEMALSAGYWLAAGLATDGIFAPDCGKAGCIGIIGAIVSEARALDEAGVDVVIIAEPEGKAEGHPALPISKEAVDRSRARIRTLSARFFDHVAAARGIEAKAVKEMNGAFFLADEAKARGLIDGVQSFEATVALAAEKGRDARQAKEKKMTDEQDLARLRAFEKDVAKQVGAENASGASGKIAALQTELEQYKAKAGEVVDLKAKLAKIEAEKADGEIVVLVDKAVAEGRVTPANKPAFLERARKHGAEWATSLIENLPVQVGSPAERGSAPIVPAKVPTVDGDLAKLLAKAGLSAEDYEKHGKGA